MNTSYFILSLQYNRKFLRGFPPNSSKYFSHYSKSYQFWTQTTVYFKQPVFFVGHHLNFCPFTLCFRALFFGFLLNSLAGVVEQSEYTGKQLPDLNASDREMC